MKLQLSVTAVALATTPAALGQMMVQTFEGSSPSQFFGQEVRAAGDVNNDGRGDIIVGAPSADDVELGAGRAQVISGLDGSVLYTFDGVNAFDRLGDAVDGAGDVNNDGYDDVIVGIPQDDSAAVNAGKAVVYSGATGLAMYAWEGTSSGDEFGFTVAGVGDLNLDGFDDVAVAAPREGLVQVYSGQSGLLLYTFTGPDTFGWSVDGAGDINGDAHPDVIVGEPSSFYNQPGSVTIYSGADGSVIRSHGGQTWPYGHDAIGGRFGASVAGVGDVNGDGRDDVLIGANYAGPYVGRALVYSGLDGSLLHEFWGTQTEDQLGGSVGGAGDVDGDGYADLVLATSPNYAYIPDAARVEIRSGLDGSMIAEFQPSGVDAFVGFTMEGVGDLNGDGYDDVAFGVPSDDAGGLNAGSVRLITGLQSGDLVGSFCFGNAADCPCGNGGSGLGGCDIPQATGGYELTVVNHTPDFGGGGTADFVASGYPVMSQPGVTLIRSPVAQAPPAVFGDGLLCLAPPVVRVGATLGIGGSSLNPVMHGAGAGTYFYQVWVRSTPIMFCDPTAAFNLSNAVSVTWP